jgi:hypothetical protein
MIDYIKDFFGNEIRIGDKVVCSVGSHAGLCFGTVTRLSKNGTCVDVKVDYAPFQGYWWHVKDMLGNIKKNVKVIVNREDIDRYRGENGIWYKDTVSTDFTYCVKFDYPDRDKQYKILKTEKCN